MHATQSLQCGRVAARAEGSDVSIHGPRALHHRFVVVTDVRAVPPSGGVLIGELNVALPRLAFAVPFVVLGALAPGLTSQEPLPRRPNLVGMEQVEVRP